MKSELARFYSLTKQVDADEQAIKEIKERQQNNYDSLVMLCPHSEAVEYKPATRGSGCTRRCKICGITDYASEGGTPGDEYNYGYPGHPSKEFWGDAMVFSVSEKKFHDYRRSHEWVVKDGKAYKRFS